MFQSAPQPSAAPKDLRLSRPVGLQAEKRFSQTETRLPSRLTDRRLTDQTHESVRVSDQNREPPRVSEQYNKPSAPEGPQPVSSSTDCAKPVTYSVDRERSTKGKAFSTGPPGRLFILFRKNNGDTSVRTARYKAQRNGYPYYTDNKDTHVFFHVIVAFGVEEASWVIARKAPDNSKKNGESEGIRATCKSDRKSVPFEGWEYVEGRFGHVTVEVTDKKPADLNDHGNEGKVDELLAALGKDEQSSGITVRDILQNMDIVEELLPQLLTDFPKIDQDSNGFITASELESYFCPKSSKTFTTAELEEIWARLISDHPQDPRVTLRDMKAHFKFIDKTIPQLINKFSEIDTSMSCTLAKNDFVAFFGCPDVWLETKLSNIIGLANLKQQISQFYWSVKLDRMRRKAGFFVNQDEAIVMMFKGNPGVGKTTFGRLIAQLLHKIEMIPTDMFVEAQRDQLVGSHIGETEKKTEELIAKAHGGVLFVDEAYRLNVKDSDKDFGKEAINALMKAMTVKGKVIVLAGYPVEMNEFVSVNPGIQRRITYEFLFDDYTPEDLACILCLQVEKRGFAIDKALDLPKLTSLIMEHTTVEQRMSMNGGMCEHIARNGVIALNADEVPRIREQGDDAEAPSVVLKEHHIIIGCDKIPKPALAFDAAAVAAVTSAAASTDTVLKKPRSGQSSLNVGDDRVTTPARSRVFASPRSRVNNSPSSRR